MGKYYDGTKLLSLKDLDGNPPEIYIVTTNRSGGKTTYFGRLCVNRFLKFKEKFALIYRFNYELDDCAEKFFKDIGSLFFQNHEMTSKRKASGIFHELFLDDISCGYAISLNSADQLKKYSHMFSDVQRCIFDEFQSESGHYCSDEIRKFLSVHTSIARGQGVQSRYVPVFMLGNSVSIINPYYTELGISNRLRTDTTYLRGVGYALEQGYVESAANAQKNSNFNRAFSANKYTAYSSENVYLNDSKAFIEKPTGKSRYVCTIKYNGLHYGIREYAERGILFVDDVADASYRLKIVVNSDDHEKNYIMLKRNDAFLILMRKYFEKGCFRFKNMNAKSALLAALSY